jgi:magnesium-transporting ATPase (P-type)
VDEQLLEKFHFKDSDMADFFRHILLNNNAVVRTVGNQIEVKSSSTDEEAFIKAAGDYGFRLLSKEGDQIKLEANGHLESYKVLAHVDYTTARKRSTIVVQKLGSNAVQLLCKGADDVLFSRSNKELSERSKTVQKASAAHVDRFATLGISPFFPYFVSGEEVLVKVRVFYSVMI